MAEYINPGFSPYTYVRTNVMRSNLLKQEDYHKLMKMSVAEITKYLQDRQYREDITALGVQESGIRLLDKALSKNVERTLTKLRLICNDELLPLVDAYMLRHDIRSIKTILRAKYTNTTRDVKELLIVLDTPRKELVEELLRTATYDEVLRKLRKSIFGKMIKEKQSLFDVENALDKGYYIHLQIIADALTTDGELFRRYLITEIEIQNLLIVLRLKKEGLGAQQINEHIITLPSSRLKRLFNTLVEAKDVAGVVAGCGKTKYKPNLEKGLAEYEKTGSLQEMERQLRKYLLRISKLFLHQNLLSINVILGFMLAKEYEVKNLRTLMKGKALGVKDSFIEEELLVL